MERPGYSRSLVKYRINTCQKAHPSLIIEWTIALRACLHVDLLSELQLQEIAKISTLAFAKIDQTSLH